MIKQGERYLVAVNGYGQPVMLDEIVVVELHDKFAKILNVIVGNIKWCYVSDLEADLVAQLPALPTQAAIIPLNPISISWSATSQQTPDNLG